MKAHTGRCCAFGSHPPVLVSPISSLNELEYVFDALLLQDAVIVRRKGCSH